ncbi:YSIRK-type signal peptide-containing protein [Streptococcus pneumoniae]
MKEFQFERKQRFSLRKYAIGACSVLLGTSLFFAGMGALGYYEGFVPYVSNQYKNQAEEEGKPLSDKYIFEKILGKTYAAFKKRSN